MPIFTAILSRGVYRLLRQKPFWRCECTQHTGIRWRANECENVHVCVQFVCPCVGHCGLLCKASDDSVNVTMDVDKVLNKLYPYSLLSLSLCLLYRKPHPPCHTHKMFLREVSLCQQQAKVSTKCMYLATSHTYQT